MGLRFQPPSISVSDFFESIKCVASNSKSSKINRTYLENWICPRKQMIDGFDKVKNPFIKSHGSGFFDTVRCSRP